MTHNHVSPSLWYRPENLRKQILFNVYSKPAEGKGQEIYGTLCLKVQRGGRETKHRKAGYRLAKELQGEKDRGRQTDRETNREGETERLRQRETDRPSPLQQLSPDIYQPLPAPPSLTPWYPSGSGLMLFSGVLVPAVEKHGELSQAHPEDTVLMRDTFCLWTAL